MTFYSTEGFFKTKMFSNKYSLYIENKGVQDNNQYKTAHSTLCEDVSVENVSPMHLKPREMFLVNNSMMYIKKLFCDFTHLVWELGG